MSLDERWVSFVEIFNFDDRLTSSGESNKIHYPISSKIAVLKTAALPSLCSTNSKAF